MLIKIYKTAFDNIGHPAKRDPTNRQSADHSMVYIIATLLRKAHEKRDKLIEVAGTDSAELEAWKYLMLLPQDYSKDAIFNEKTRALMPKIQFEHGGL